MKSQKTQNIYISPNINAKANSFQKKKVWQLKQSKLIRLPK
jgi:hypothetical protein